MRLMGCTRWPGRVTTWVARAAALAELIAENGQRAACRSRPPRTAGTLCRLAPPGSARVVAFTDGLIRLFDQSGRRPPGSRAAAFRTTLGAKRLLARRNHGPRGPANAARPGPRAVTHHDFDVLIVGGGVAGAPAPVCSGNSRAMSSKRPCGLASSKRKRRGHSQRVRRPICGSLRCGQAGRAVLEASGGWQTLPAGRAGALRAHARVAGGQHALRRREHRLRCRRQRRGGARPHRRARLAPAGPVARPWRTPAGGSVSAAHRIAARRAARASRTR